MIERGWNEIPAVWMDCRDDRWMGDAGGMGLGCVGRCGGGVVGECVVCASVCGKKVMQKMIQRGWNGGPTV